MKNIFILLFSLSIQFAFSQINQVDDNGEKHGVWKKFYDEKELKLRYQGEFDHGVPVNTFLYYFPNKNVEIENVYRGNTGVCYSKQYDERKNLEAEGVYNNQQKDSVWTYYGLKGQLVSREGYKEGELHGEVVIYYTDGKTAEKTRYVDGVKNGEWVQKYEDGKNKAKATYIDGALEGEAIYYDFNGRPFYKGNYKKGLKIGVWYTFESGKVTKKETFKKGYLDKVEEYE